MDSMADKRKLERFDLELAARVSAVDCENDNSGIELITSDVCSGGAFFSTDQPLPEGTQVKIDLVLPLDQLREIKGNKAMIKVSGFVIRVLDSGMAICFDPDYDISPVP